VNRVPDSFGKKNLPFLPQGYCGKNAGMSDMVHRVIGLRQDGSYLELERCSTRERAVEIRRLAAATGEFSAWCALHANVFICSQNISGRGNDDEADQTGWKPTLRLRRVM
jgi:hypothetical protein